ncbi:cytochrome P450 [Coniochaeta sp. 2T2.1]|nr:cytochrome P450 [Coniochaeta sp. 2T2.1]
MLEEANRDTLASPLPGASSARPPCKAAHPRNPPIWGEDADKFDPDRWDRLEGDGTDVHAWEPFLQGPRVCIVRALAWLEFRAVVVELVRRFGFGRVEQGEIALVNPSRVLRPAAGLRVKVVKRE